MVVHIHYYCKFCKTRIQRSQLLKPCPKCGRQLDLRYLRSAHVEVRP